MTRESLDRTQLVDALSGDAESRRRALADLLACTPEERRLLVDRAVAGRLVALLGDGSRTHQRQAADVARALLGDTASLGEALHDALLSPSSRLRWGAAYTLGHSVPPPRAIWPVVWETLGRTDGDQRWAAAELACTLARHHPGVLDDLRTALSTGSPTQRKMVLYCLRDLGTIDLAAVGVERLADADAGVRLAALSALSRSSFAPEERERSARAVAELIAGDPDPGVRRAAAVTLSKLGVRTPAVVSVLERAAKGEDESLARAAAGALARLGDERGRC